VPTTPWSTIRIRVNEELGYYEVTAAAITTTQIQAPAFEGIANQDDWFIGWYTSILAGSNTNVERLCSDYTADGGVFTQLGPVYIADSSARLVAVGRFQLGLVKLAVNEARDYLFPHLCQVRDYQSLVTGQRQYAFTLPSTMRDKPIAVYIGNRPSAETLPENLFSNGGFENWTDSTTPVSWTIAGSGSAVTQEEETTTPKNYAVLQDSNSAKLVVAASTATTLLQTVTPSVAAEGQEVNVSVWVYCQTASRVSAQISGTNVVSTPVTGTAHGGTGWELLTVSAATNQAATAFAAGVDVTSGAAIACFIDEALCTVGPSEPLDNAWTPIYDWRWVPPVDGATNNGRLEFDRRLPEKRRLRVVGRDLLSTIAEIDDDTSTMEVAGEELELLANFARTLLITRQLYNLPSQERAFWLNQRDRFKLRADELIALGVGTPTPNQRVPVPVL